MINKITIKDFKSIKDISFDSKKVNIFIGKPNTGKSNILESLGLINYTSGSIYQLNDFVRYGSFQNLFYDDGLENPVRITIDDDILVVKYEKSQYIITTKSGNNPWVKRREISLHGLVSKHGNSAFRDDIRYYRFKKVHHYPQQGMDHLLPPYGENLFSIIIAKKDFKKIFSDFFADYGYKAVLKPQELTFEFSKVTEDIMTSFPYILASETLQRMIFYTFAIDSNQNSVLVFEEPESHAFPYYTKYLGEKISLDTSNQYFIATHNPYLLQAIIDKSKIKDLNVIITYYVDYRTKIKVLKENEISDLMEYDPFFNIDKFIDEGDH